MTALWLRRFETVLQRARPPVLEAGPGRFDTRELNRLAGLVAVEELDRVEHEVS